jgi:hypothetical protein
LGVIIIIIIMDKVKRLFNPDAAEQEEDGIMPQVRNNHRLIK